MKNRYALLLVAALFCAAPLAADEWTDLSDGLRPSENIIVGAQPTEDVLRQAAEAGIKVVVNFRGVNEDPGYDEAALAAELGLTYLRVPVEGPADLGPENVALLDAVLRHVGDQPALMHCASGNRTGALFAMHAARYRGMEPEAAIEFGRAHGLTRAEPAVREALGQ
jgi:uncharacterized protein (TIGR01244 family)